MQDYVLWRTRIRVDVWEQLARIEGTTDSGYFKKYLRSEKSKLKELEEVQDKFSGFVL